MIVLGFLLAGVSIWNFIVGVWGMGIVCAVFAVLCFALWMED